MYLDLYKGLGLGDEDLTKYDSPLVGFDGKIGDARKTDKAPRSDRRE